MKARSDRRLFFSGQVYIFMASQWDSAPQRIVALVNRHVTSIQVHGASCLSATTKDGFALLLQPSGDATSHLADQYQVTETIVVNGEKIVAVQVVEGCVAVLTDKGQVFTRGTNALVLGHPPSENFRPPIGLESVFVASISFSDEHALALDKASSVYSWGIPVEGRLGLGETVLDMPVVASPRKISHLKVCAK
jgi:alpha-tubulin suppressor-like RCC1 family protein